MDFSFQTASSGKSLENSLRNLLRGDLFGKLSSYGERGVRALSAATPTESGETAASWSYKVTKEGRSYKITWYNDHMAGRTPVAILLQYGHATGTGGYVPGRDYINPAMKPILDELSNEGWKVVTSS